MLRYSIDAHWHSSKLWWLDAEILRVIPGKEIVSTTLAALGVHCSTISGCKTNVEHDFCFSLFFHNTIILFIFLSVNENSY